MPRFRIFALTLLFASIASADPVGLTGVNLAGGDFYVPKQNVRAKYNQDFEYPNAAELDYFQSKGVNFVRIPFMWETLQPDLSKPFLADEMQRYKDVVKLATSRKMVVLLDPHNYARHYGKIIGSADVSFDDFADFWKRLSGEFADDPYVLFGLNNEPHDMPTAQWYTAANAAIAAIRAGGAKNLILVPGNAWTGGQSWLQNWYGEPNSQHMLTIKDPLNYWIIEIHQYLDEDSSGTKTVVVSPTIGSERLKGFVGWARNIRCAPFSRSLPLPSHLTAWVKTRSRTCSQVSIAIVMFGSAGRGGQQARDGAITCSRSIPKMEKIARNWRGSSLTSTALRFQNLSSRSKTAKATARSKFAASTKSKRPPPPA